MLTNFLHHFQVHSVAPEAIERLLMLIPNLESSNGGGALVNNGCDSAEEREGGTPSDSSRKGSTSTPPGPFPCPSCSIPFETVDDLYKHQAETNHITLKETPTGPGYLCWNKGCNQYFKSVPSLQTHFREIHAKRLENVTAAISERHVYKYRCTQCSLAFRTEEKLKHHQQYHVMRAATKCAICGRNFRSIDGLRKHVETTHVTLTAPHLQQYKADVMAIGGNSSGFGIPTSSASNDTWDELGQVSSSSDDWELNTIQMAEEHFDDLDR